MLKMANRVDQVNMDDAMLSGNTFSVKEEQCQENSFIEDKVCISETSITTDNAELQGCIWYDKIKQYEESTCLENIKTELASFEMPEVQNDNIEIGLGITADDIKTEFYNGLLYCEHCEAYYKDYCLECGMLASILNKNTSNNADYGTREDIPNDILEIQHCFGQTGVYALRIIPEGVKFGPFTGLSETECPWKREGEQIVLKNKSKNLNWMQYVNPTRNTSELNLHVFRCEDNVYYQSTRQIQAGEELLVYFAEEYENCPNKNIGFKDVFACTFCCLGFSSKTHLANHRAICVEDAAEKFSIEELTQCPFCKIHLDLKEYFKHHMPFCCDRNARKSILPSPSAKKATTALNERKNYYLRPIYKCEKKCKYRTKYHAYLKKHISDQHYNVKMYKCGICNRRFKAKESLRLHMENRHTVVGEKDEEHATTDYRNTLIKVEQTSSTDKKKIFKCSLCVFEAKYKQSLRKHTKTKHLKEFDFKCNSCKFGTNYKRYLEGHIKTKHLKHFDYKCDQCQYRTNNKHYLEGHIKTKHLKTFDFNCDKCEYRTNNKSALEEHRKTKHLKQFDFKCDSCEYSTNTKYHLEYHIKTIHLQEFDYKCDVCGFSTNYKNNLENHIKTKHLKQFDYKCNSCEFGTNGKSTLDIHIKTKHLKEFDFDCEKCEYRTNNKRYLDIHIKTKHLKEFHFKCAVCEYRTNMRTQFKRHLKTKHLKEFDFKCDSCGFAANIKNRLERHIKTIHLKQFDFKCDSCEFKTNRKDHLGLHIKTKHANVFE